MKKSSFEKETGELRIKLQTESENHAMQLEQLNDLKLKYDKAVEEIQKITCELQNSTTENEEFKKRLDEAKELKYNYDEAIKENQYMKNKLRFLEKNAVGSVGMCRSSAENVPQFNNNYLADLNGEVDIDEFQRTANCDTRSLKVSPTFIIEKAESFDNTHLAELKRGFNVDNKRIADDLQKRNSQYPPHLKDSYAIGNLDKDMNELEMKFGSYDTLPNDLRHRKLTTNYRRPSSIPTPSKHALPSISASTSTPNEVAATSENKQTTQSRVKNFLSSFAKGKDEVSYF